jgi:DNA transposition AAA+ family ATPase
MIEIEQEAPPSSMTNERADRILRRIETYLARGYTQARICNEAELAAPGKLGQMFSREGRTQFGTWWTAAAVQDDLMRLERWADAEDTQGADERGAWANTPTFDAIHQWIAFAQHNRALVAITGPWGIGKSEAASAYAATHPRMQGKRGALHIEFHSLVRTDYDVLTTIIEALQGQGAHAHRSDNMNALSALLGPGDVLILNECNRLTGKRGPLGVIQDIHERARVGIVMIGNPDLKAAASGKEKGFEAIASRARHIALPGTTDEDVDAWLSWAGLKGKDWRKLCIAVAKTPGANGGLRPLGMALKEFRAMKKSDGTPPDIEDFKGLLMTFGKFEE